MKSPTSDADSSSLTAETNANAAMRLLVVHPEKAAAKARLAGALPAATVTAAATIAEARRALGKDDFALVLCEATLPDGPADALLDTIAQRRPATAAVVTTRAACVDATVGAFRRGALDVLAGEPDGTHLAERVTTALARQADLNRKARRLVRLKSAVRRLNKARRTVSEKVDLLCNDLVGAYGELAKQLEQTRLAGDFRSTVREARDLEQALCHSMDWLLRKCGYTNVAVFLAGEDDGYELGAYMKYTHAGTKPLTEALKTATVDRAVVDDYLRWTASDAADVLAAGELAHLHGQQLMAVNCTYLGESLGVIALFRDEKTPFTGEDEAALRAAAPLFAQALTTLAKGEDGAEEAASSDEGDAPWDERPKNEKKRGPKKPDPADWWKLGEESPY